MRSAIISTAFVRLGAAVVFLGGCSGRSLQPGFDAGNGAVPVATRDGGAAEVTVVADGGVVDQRVVVDSAATDLAVVVDGAATDLPGNAVVGRHSYVVVSSYRSVQDGGAPPPQSSGSQSFTLVLDATAGVVRVGTNTVPMARIDTGTFRTAASFSMPLPIGCYSAVAYDELTIVVTGGGISAVGRGKTFIGMSDAIATTPAEMSLVGIPDTVPASLIGAAGTNVNPLLDLAFSLSEPVPAGASATLLAVTGGDPITLMPMMSSDGQAVHGFQKPNIVLRYGEGYGVVTNGLVDFAGNLGPVAAGTFTTRALPTRVSEDGFESAADGPYAGGQLVSGAGWPVLAGTRSFYWPAMPGGPPPAVPPWSLRLALAPGDTVVRFSYRVVAPYGGSGFWSLALWVGAIGASSAGYSLMAESGALPAFQLPNQSAIYLGELRTAELPVPVGATGDIVIEPIGSTGASCSTPPRPTPGLIIDDLRAE